MAFKKPVALYQSTISSTIGKTDTTIPVTDFDDGEGGTLTNGSVRAFIIDEGENSGNADFGQEFIIGTVDTSGLQLTSCTRGLSLVDGTSSVTANKKKHKRGASIKMTNHPYLLDVIRALNGETQFDADNIMEYDAAPSFTPGSNELATVKYADDLAIAGGVDASTSAKGITKLSVAPASATSPIAVGDNDPRMLSQAENDLVSAITASAAEINVLDGIDGNVTATILNEMGGFFANTSITGTQATTLTAGVASSADDLHLHKLMTLIENSNNARTRGITTAINDLETTSSGSAVARSYGGWQQLDTGTTSGSAYILSPSTTTPEIQLLSWDDAQELVTQLALSQTTAQDVFWGLYAAASIPANATLTARHAAFMVEDGTIYASVADGTTQTRTSIAVTLTNFNTYRIAITPGVNVKFYVNGTLMATLTTNLPTGATTYGSCLIGIANTAAARKAMAISRPYAYFAGVPSP